MHTNKPRVRRRKCPSTRAPTAYKPLHAAKVAGQGPMRNFCKKFHAMRLAEAQKDPVGKVAGQNCVGCSPCCPGIVLGNIVNYFANVTYVSTDFPAVILHLVLFGFSIAVLIFASGKYVINGTRVDSQLVFVTLLVQQILLKCGATGRQNFCCVCPVLNRVFCGHINVDIDLARVADSVRDVHWRPYTFPSANYYIPPIISANGQRSAQLLMIWYHFATGMEVEDDDLLLTARGQLVGRGRSGPASIRGKRPIARMPACSMLTNSIDALGFPVVQAAAGNLPDDNTGGGGGGPPANNNDDGSARRSGNRLHDMTKHVQTKVEGYLRKVARANPTDELDRRTRVVFSKYGFANFLRCLTIEQAREDFAFMSDFLPQFQTSASVQPQPKNARHRQNTRAWERAFDHPQRIGLVLPTAQFRQVVAEPLDPFKNWQDAFSVMPSGRAQPEEPVAMEEAPRPRCADAPPVEVGYAYLQFDPNAPTATILGPSLHETAAAAADPLPEVEITAQQRQQEMRMRVRSHWNRPVQSQWQ